MATDSAKILVVDDDPAIRNLVERFLSQKKYQVESAADGKSALVAFDSFNPDLVILDVNLPDALGYNLCEQMQSRTDVFVLMLTSRNDTEDKAIGFRKGADDYLTKPFDLQELEFRVGAILKRKRVVATPPEKEIIEFGYLAIDPQRREVKVSGQLVSFTSLEFDLLYYLASHPNEALSRPTLIKDVWDYDDMVGDQRVVDVHIGQIRKKIENDSAQPSLIKTIRGYGYRFELPEL
ncbi:MULTISPECIES: response regulator transcription factor [Spirulina sp. CCY15215]|uniref:response regulator transcription factor n=1 Tax=Spirulina sp. CCY15215 TaxID=2767591 RepID=UPI00194DC3CA|nr:response regulator transcription factor [Spirulina major]